MIWNDQTGKGLIASAFSIALTIIFILPFCGWMFQCGCTFLWSGGHASCNIHHAGMPHCPWCVGRSPLAMALPFLLILGGQVGAILYFNNKFNLPMLVSLIIGIFAFLMLGAVTGYIFKVMDGYPYFFTK